MSLVHAIPGAAAHVAAFIGTSALIGSAWASPHAICLAAAVTLFGGKFLRAHFAREVPEVSHRLPGPPVQAAS